MSEPEEDSPEQQVQRIEEQIRQLAWEFTYGGHDSETRTRIADRQFALKRQIAQIHNPNVYLG